MKLSLPERRCDYPLDRCPFSWEDCQGLQIPGKGCLFRNQTTWSVNTKEKQNIMVKDMDGTKLVSRKNDYLDVIEHGEGFTSYHTRHHESPTQVYYHEQSRGSFRKSQRTCLRLRRVEKYDGMTSERGILNHPIRCQSQRSPFSLVFVFVIRQRKILRILKAPNYEQRR